MWGVRCEVWGVRCECRTMLDVGWAQSREQWAVSSTQIWSDWEAVGDWVTVSTVSPDNITHHRHHYNPLHQSCRYSGMLKSERNNISTFPDVLSQKSIISVVFYWRFMFSLIKSQPVTKPQTSLKKNVCILFFIFERGRTQILMIEGNWSNCNSAKKCSNYWGC